MAIVTLPLSVQLINGNVADGAQVMTDLNQIASNVNANAAKNGVNSDITSMTALTSITSALTVTGWNIASSTITGGTITGAAITATNAVLTTPAITGGTITGAALDATCTVPTAAPGTSTTEIASTAFVAATAFSSALPAISGGTTDEFVTNNGSVASWSALLKAGTMRWADSSDTTKRLTFGLSGITTGTTRTLTIANRDSNIGSLPISSRTSNTILAASDYGSFVDITSGTFSQTFTAAATLGAGWWCILRNSGTGDITLDPNGAELIDGLATYIMYPNESRIVQCNGTGFTTVVLSFFVKNFTTSGTFTKPPGYALFDIEAASGGGGGGSGPALSVGQMAQFWGGTAGGGDGRGCITVPASSVGTTETVTIGAGGVGGAGVSSPAAGNNGTDGGTTSFGNWLKVTGGKKGTGGTNAGTQLGGVGGSGFPSTSNDGGVGGSDVNPVPTSSVMAAAGGGSGGQINGGVPSGGSTGGAVNATNSGYNGTIAGGAGGAASANGSPGSNSPTGSTVGGSGGGGGGASATTPGAGGLGGFPGGGGGGGGGIIAASGLSGAGGAGNSGILIIRGG